MDKTAAAMSLGELIDKLITLVVIIIAMAFIMAFTSESAIDDGNTRSALKIPSKLIACVAYTCSSMYTKVRSRIRETGGMWPFARQRCCPPGRYWYQSKALRLPDLTTLTAGLQRRN